MNEIVLKTKNLNKKYILTHALKDFNISINKGDIYGLIGPNGAGKTTFIRIITGLAYASSGSYELFGKNKKSEIARERKRIGALIERPKFYKNKTAYENLNINRMMKGIKDKQLIDEVLEIVGLKDTGSKRVKNFSLGMKQRLGIARALVGNSEFLILDEPVNGLDPLGIIDVRKLLLKLNKEHGKTILISSHILEELSLIATRYGIINKGSIVEELTADELRNKFAKGIIITVDNASEAIRNLKENQRDIKCEKINNTQIRIESNLEAGKINGLLLKKGIVVEEFKKQNISLEEYFIQTIGGQIDE
ncbi:MAG: ABC transporter ATP-binding protein [Candidatus Woesearchaeota archaeon]